MRVLGLDLGTRTLGVSISDETKFIATPVATIRYEEGDYPYLLEKLEKVLNEFQVETIVLGLPKNMDNSMGEHALMSVDFKELLEEKLKIPVVLQDERLSTVEATNYMITFDISRKKRKKKVDSLAANIILQTYLDKRKGNEYARRKNDF
ncbi:MAG: Holliday junction resolvase RuvX [Firmicutes bacterium]|nr:Holliday junction resolvase RuvX [Bacillota bacterium]